MSGTRRWLACILTSIVVLFAVGWLFHVALPLVAPPIAQEFETNPIFRPWPGWTRAYMIVHPVWFGTVFAGAFVFLRSRETIPPGWRGGAAYGVAVFLAGALPIYAIVFASLAIPPAVIGFWMIHSLCQYAAAGAALGLVDDRQTLCKTNLG